MAGSTQQDDALETVGQRDELSPITLRVVLSGILGGVVGLAAMIPVAVGVPAVLGLFELENPEGFAVLVGAEPSVALGITFFALGGAVVLPLFFVVTADFLPPEEPRYLRGVTMATIFWPGFVISFWPGGGGAVATAFVVFSLLGHWAYGLALGGVLTVLTGIPEHDV